MRKLILQIRYTIFSRLLCVRHLQTILPYSPYLYGIFAFYSNFSPLPEFTFAKRKVFWLNWNLLFQFTSVELTRNEFRILRTLLENKGRIVSRQDLMLALWQDDCYVEENTLTVNVGRLRKKLEEAGLRDVIVTKPGRGYLIS